jgi:hypothetical protein
MLKYINFQLIDDEEAQQLLEKDIAPVINTNIRQNIDAFRQHIPSLVSILQEHNIQQHSLFCNKNGQLNVVNFATGRVLYGMDPQAEVAAEVESFCKQAPFFQLDDTHNQPTWNSAPLPLSADVIIMFGLGLGQQLQLLLQSCRVRYLIVYEPELDILSCSVQATDWRDILEMSAIQGTHLFLQIGSDASSLPSELKELLEHDSTLNQIFVYRHCYHPVMDKVLNYLMQYSGQRLQLLQTSHVFSSYSEFQDYVPERSNNVLGTALVSAKIGVSNDLFHRNMDTLERFYPDIHKELSKHQPKHWRYVIDDCSQPNLYHDERRALFHYHTLDEYWQLFDYFVNNPFRDDVILGVNSGGKLWRYLHFKYMRQSNQLLADTLKKQTKLPQAINSLIVFGVALGKHIELLTEQHQIQNLMICEPNIDFFYASLQIVDWEAIIKRADSAKQRIYLNLGDNTNHYFNDLMAQFYQIGAYSVADTYMLSTYYNVSMQKAIGDLRADLKVVLALGEYFDHAYYGISHTYYGLENGYRFMQQKPASAIRNEVLALPVFIVGNGPSLDESIQYIQEHRNKVVVVSCGTALRALHNKGVKPDFHAEIEQNRATYDWMMQINDLLYLKEIRLLSVNGIHPDTAALFKEVLLCFKEGEAATYVFNNGLKKLGYDAMVLSYAYPTVTNMVLNYFLKWGFKYFYLHGVDLGYHDINKHHSSFSSYYKADGSEVYDYQKHHGGGVPAAGNFVPQVFTKPEFDVSRKLLEQAIKTASHKIEVYNCSNGVRIAGTQKLLPEHILLPDDVVAVGDWLSDLIDATFYPPMKGKGLQIIDSFDKERYEESITQWQQLLSEDATDQLTARDIIASQWTFLRSRAITNNDITFCLFHGSANYYAGILTKLASNIGEDTPQVLETFNKVLGLWRDYLTEAHQRYLDAPLALDTTTVQAMFNK